MFALGCSVETLWAVYGAMYGVLFTIGIVCVYLIVTDK